MPTVDLRGAAPPPPAAPAATAAPAPCAASVASSGPHGLGDLVAGLRWVRTIDPRACVMPVVADLRAHGRVVVHLAGPDTAGRPGVGLAPVEPTAQVVVRAVDRAVAEGWSSQQTARVLLVGAGGGAVAAVQVAARGGGRGWSVDHVVVVGSPAALVPRLPAHTRLLALGDGADQATVLAAWVAGRDERCVAVLVDLGDHAEPYLPGARAADASENTALRTEIGRLRTLGYLER